MGVWWWVWICLLGSAEVGLPVKAWSFWDPAPRHPSSRCLAPLPAPQGDSGTEGFRCPEMLEGRPWLWQADAYAAAGVAHCLLHGDYMEVDRVADPQGAPQHRGGRGTAGARQAGPPARPQGLRRERLAAALHLRP